MAEPMCRAIRPLLSAALDGELPAPEAAAVEQHVAACADCAAEQRALGTVRSLLRSLPERCMPEHLAAGAAGRARVRRRRLAVAGTTMAVLVGLLGGAAFALGGQPPPEARTVRVPMEVFVADHLAHAVNGTSGITADDGAP